MSGSGPLRELSRSRKVDVALQNEQITRERVGRLEAQMGHAADARATELEFEGTRQRLDRLERPNPLLGILLRDFWGRLAWLLLGR